MPTVNKDTDTHFAKSEGNAKAWDRFIKICKKTDIFKDYINNYVCETQENQDKLKSAKGLDAKIRVIAKDRMQFYADNGVDTSYDVAVEEVYSKFCGDTLFGDDSEKALENIIKYADRQEQKAVARFLNKLKAWIQKVFGKSDELNKITRLEREWLKLVKQAGENYAVKEDITEGDIRYNLKNNLLRQLNDWLSGNGKKNGSYNGQFFDLGTTPDVLIKHGAKNTSLIMLPSCISKITGAKHSISLDEIAKLPEQLNDPILLFKGSVKDSFVALTELTDKSGNDVIAAIHINKKVGRAVINKIASLYSKTNDYGKNKIVAYVNNQIAQGNLIDASKNKAPNWFTTRGLQLPNVVQTILDANNSIRQNNTKSQEKSAQIDSKEFKQWFGNSKAVNKDGTPKVLYHWTNADFTVFDTERSGSNQGKTKGDGIYLSSIKDDFSYAGDKVMKLYASIKTPFEMELSKRDAEYIYDIYFAPYHKDTFNTYRPHVITSLMNPVKVFDYLNEAAETNNTKTSTILSELGYDGVHSGSEWVAFEPTQVKSATDNVGTFDKNNPDIRYSISSENIRLNPDRYTSWLLRHFSLPSGQAAVEYYSEQIQEIVKLFNKGGENTALAQEKLHALALDMADTLQGNLTPWSQEIVDYVKGTKVSLTTTQEEEVRNQFKNLRVFANRTGIIVSQNANTTLDEQWEEWAGQYPEWFTPDTSEGNQVTRLVEIMDAVKSDYELLDTESLAAQIEEQISYNKIAR